VAEAGSRRDASVWLHKFSPSGVGQRKAAVRLWAAVNDEGESRGFSAPVEVQTSDKLGWKHPISELLLPSQMYRALQLRLSPILFSLRTRTTTAINLYLAEQVLVRSTCMSKKLQKVSSQRVP